MSNVLPDPGFEDRSWTLVGDPLYVAYAGPTPVHAGVSSLMLRSEPLSSGYANSPAFDVVLGRKYTVAGWYRADGIITDHILLLVLHNAVTDAVVHIRGIVPPVINTWLYYVSSLDWAAPTGRVYMRADTYKPAVGITTVRWYVDDLALIDTVLAKYAPLTYPEESPGKPPHKFLRSLVDPVTGAYVREDRIVKDRQDRWRARGDVDELGRDELHYPPRPEQEPIDP